MPFSEKHNVQYNGVKVFSTTKYREREYLGETITKWIRSNPDLEIVDRQVKQSSDREFHCLSIILFYIDPNASNYHG